jgi:LysM repeat protein
LLLGLGVVFLFMCILQWRFGGRAHAELGAANTGQAVELTKVGQGDPGTACGSALVASPGVVDSAVAPERQLNIADVKNGLRGRNEDSVLMTTTTDSGTVTPPVVPDPAATTERPGPAPRGPAVLPEADGPATTLDPGTASYTVKPGDSFAKIAKAQGLKSQDIAKLNPGIDSNKMKVGMKLVIPAKATETAVLPGHASLPAPTRDPAPASGQKTYTVAAGDSLGSISTKMYGTCKKAALIASANKGINPNSLKVGTKLVIPAAPAAPASPITPAVAPSSSPATLDTDTMMAGAPRSHRTSPLARGSVPATGSVEPLVDPSAYPDRISVPHAGATPPTTSATGGPAEVTTPGPAARALSRTTPTSPVASVVSMNDVR